MAIAQVVPIFADGANGELLVTIGPETREIDREAVIAILEGRSADSVVLAAQIALAVMAGYPTPSAFANASAAQVAALVANVWWPA